MINQSLFPILCFLIEMMKRIHRIDLVIFFLHQIPVEAAAIAGMAGCTDLYHIGQQRIVVAVDGQALYVLEVARGLSLDPQFLTAAAPVSHPAGLDRLVEGFFVHIRQHQDFVIAIILYDNRNQAVTVQFELRPGDGRLLLPHIQPLHLQ